MRKMFINILCACIPVKHWRKRTRIRMLDASPATQAQINEILKRIDQLAGAFQDPDGLDSFRLLLRLLGVDRQFYPVLFGIQPGDVCIDCGMHSGAFTDVVLFRGGITYGFEPNPVIFPFLLKKFCNEDNAICINKAVDSTAGERTFHFNGAVDSVGASMINWSASEENTPGSKVECVRLVDYLEDEILPRHGKVYLLKLDVEGAEFDIIPDLIESGLYKKIDHLFCETHARFFTDGKTRLENLNRLISERGITNINLNWV